MRSSTGVLWFRRHCAGAAAVLGLCIVTSTLQVQALQPPQPDNPLSGQLSPPSRSLQDPTPARWWFLVPESYQIRRREQEKRKFPEVDSRGFDEDIFDEGFGEFHPMKRWS